MSCADVCIDHDYDYYNEFYRESLRVARKLHMCCECGEAVAPGQQYQVASGKSDGRIWTAASCALCAEIRSAFVCGSWEFGRLWVSIEEEMFPIWREKGPLDCLAQTKSRAARDKLRRAYAKWRAFNRLGVDVGQPVDVNYET